MLDKQYTELSKIVSYRKIKVLHTHDIPIFENLLKTVSHFALNLLVKQLSIVEDDLACTTLFSSTFGLPCSHRLREIAMEKRSNYLIFILSGLKSKFLKDILILVRRHFHHQLPVLSPIF